ncbi:MAG TPA: hypothetical protein VJT33_13075 [bacterium]|nr:hypothetical protein [bacterium]
MLTGAVFNQSREGRRYPRAHRGTFMEHLVEPVARERPGFDLGYRARRGGPTREEQAELTEVPGALHNDDRPLAMLGLYDDLDLPGLE